MPEPWLRGTTPYPDPIRSQLLFSFEQTLEDVESHTRDLPDEDMSASPGGIASISFHIGHIAGSINRLFTYAAGQSLSEQQMIALRKEAEPRQTREELMCLLRQSIDAASKALAAIDPISYQEPRYVGRKKLPTTVGNLLVHVAEHTQRHVGQLITTAKILKSQSVR